MIEIKLNDSEGGILAQFDFPASISEMRLSQYIDFLVALRDFRKEGVNEVAVMARAVAVFAGIDPVEIIQAKVGVDYEQTALDNEPTIFSLYNYLLKLIEVHRPRIRTIDEAIFEHKGETFQIPASSKAIVMGISKKDLSVIEAVEAFEVKRRVSEAMKVDGDPTGSFWFSEYLHLLAILARHPGESLPLDDDERTTFIANRAAFFSDISLDIALDVDFFLTTGLLRVNLTPHLLGSISLQTLLILAEHRRKIRTYKKPRTLQRRLRGARAGVGSLSKLLGKAGSKLIH